MKLPPHKWRCVCEAEGLRASGRSPRGSRGGANVGSRCNSRAQEPRVNRWLDAALLHFGLHAAFEEELLASCATLAGAARPSRTPFTMAPESTAIPLR